MSPRHRSPPGLPHVSVSDYVYEATGIPTLIVDEILAAATNAEERREPPTPDTIEERLATQLARVTVATEYLTPYVLDVLLHALMHDVACGRAAPATLRRGATWCRQRLAQSRRTG